MTSAEKRLGVDPGAEGEPKNAKTVIRKVITSGKVIVFAVSALSARPRHKVRRRTAAVDVPGRAGIVRTVSERGTRCQRRK